MKYFIYTFLFVSLAFFQACDTDENIPTFIEVNSVSLTTTDLEGANTHNISDVWVFVDGQGIGVWPLPARIPTFPTNGEVEIQFFAGVRVDGISDKARIYPFYAPVIVNEDLLAGETYEYDLTFEYFDITKFDFIEGFESRNIFSEDNDGDPNTFMVRSQLDARTGDYCGYIKLVDTADLIEVTTQFAYPTDDILGGGIYLEMDYRADIPIIVGYIADGQFRVEDINNVIIEKDDWNKIYLDLSQVLGSTDIETYRIKIASGLVGSGLSEGNIYLDNIKLLHF